MKRKRVRVPRRGASPVMTAGTRLDAAGGCADRWRMDAERLLLSMHAGATLFMTGVIWFVQVVHYPLLARAGTDGFAEHAREHARRTGWIVGPAMVAELILSLALAARGGAAAWTGLGLLTVIWLSTALVQVPLHRRLQAGFEAETHRQLVRTNRLRTAAWTARAAIALHLAAG
ncbi:MAG: hypothetical protein RLZZ188_2974 [Verrucomicrobiota bacterium]|jgi:hypothetical protein